MPEAAELYIDLLKRTLCRFDFGDDRYPVTGDERLRRVLTPLQALLAKRSLQLTKTRPFDPVRRAEGSDLPAAAETMIGLRRLDNLHQSIRTIIGEGIPGDLLEAGVWRGGAAILMRGVLKAYGVQDRTVWAADSFNGLPAPKPEHAADLGDTHSQQAILAVSLEEVRTNFQRYNLLDEQVRFLEGWFSDTLPVAPIEQLSLLRLDGDMYGSTQDVLSALYPKVAPGGFVIVDDYGYLSSCREAIHDYRAENNVVETIHEIDWTGVYWRKSSAVSSGA